jgi:hypothetical protein
MMINPMKPVEYLRWFSIKKLVFIIFALGMSVMPEDLLHLLAVIAHTIYESIAFAIEHFLVHAAGFSKFQAQMTLFYMSFAIGVMSMIALIRRVPKLADRAEIWATKIYTQARTELIYTWHALPTRRKLELLLVQFAGIVSVMAFAMA